MFAAIAVLLFFSPSPVLCAASLASENILGNEYVRLADWAASQKFTVKWIQPRKTLEVRGAGWVIGCEVDSRRVEIGGVALYLSTPVALKEGEAWLAIRDIRKLILPILSPPKLAGKARIKTICLDAGHGGRDPGNSHGNLREKDLTLRLARELQLLLQKSGYKVVMTRSGDVYPELDERPLLANRRKADLFLSLHFNAARDSEGVRGAETFCLTPAGHPSTNERQSAGSAAFPGNKNDPFNLLLAYNIQRSMVTKLGSEDRGVKRQRFAVLKAPNMPAVLVEAGFLSDTAEARLISNPNHLSRIAQALHSGIESYRRQVERR